MRLQEQMSYGQIAVDLLTRALEREERELRELWAAEGDTERPVHSVQEYTIEPWIVYLLFKQSLRDNFRLKLNWEYKFDKTNRWIDFVFLNDKTLVATFELKPFDHALSRAKRIRPLVIQDFEKQYERARQQPSVEHYVVLVPWGSNHAIEAWCSCLENQLGQAHPEIVIRKVPPSHVKLNGQDENYLSVRGFRVS